jgi:hypothetical protein
LHIISTQKSSLLAAAELATRINDWGLLERFLKEPEINVANRDGLSPYLQLLRAGVPADKLEFLSSEEEINQDQLNQEFLRAGLIALAEGFNDRVEKALSSMRDGPEKTMLTRYKTYDSEDFRLHLDQDFGDDPFKDYINSIASTQKKLLHLDPINRDQIIEIDVVESIRKGSFDNAFNMIAELSLDPESTRDQQNKAYFMV